MCGITGFIDFSPAATAEGLEKRVRDMADSLRHRGPDADGVFTDAESGLALGHRRLAIIDLSESGAQPMRSRDGRYVLVHNGEIYNYLELRAELETEGGPFLPWRGTSDTEVMLAAFASWGVEKAVRRFSGMFAFALWDVRERTLFLARDRMGEKPLYYSRTGQFFIFGSELKALRASGVLEPELDMGAVAQYLRFQYIPAPRTIYQGVRKLRPGHLLALRPDNPDRLESAPYWSLKDAVNRGLYAPFQGGEEEAVDQLETLLRATVRNQMLSDVPLGSLLSGGVDSSLVTALMQAESSRPVRTFTIGYDDPAYDEAGHARRVAEHLGTEHTELTVTPRQALDLVPALPRMYDEPFADASMIPTHLVAALTRKHVTVCLSGDGGDETFAGYNRHVWAPAVWERMRSLPPRVRRIAARAIRMVSPGAYNTIFSMLPGRSLSMPGYKLHRVAEVLGLDSREDVYKSLASTWQNPEQVLVSGQEPPSAMDMPSLWPGLTEYTAWMQFLDSVSYLPGDILTKVDRAAMACSLESRAPFLDHKVVEFAWRLPLSMKLRGKQGKYILRRVLDRHVPRELVDRPKTGFGIPIDTWLRGPLRPWAEELLSPNRLAQQGILRPEVVGMQWADHLSGRRDNQFRIWNILMLQAWLNEWM
ncbi:asparagine synthase (glutamine-hydrolyzing) [Salidesulfovibrio onnuriiensis]|uniref:asparagine synthase (glutamine-hydrolyzing) n=1 Tax=Salidesulfovibrio onnuriiensis TaxID=2583823 RepID=UPI0011C8C9DD|nr:asparagine synthase (glutamine-hydrolyzing) [Salidesulfovibrio onnuriiensis]